MRHLWEALPEQKRGRWCETAEEMASRVARDLDAGDVANTGVIALVASFLPIAAAFALFDATQVSAAQALRGLQGEGRWGLPVEGCRLLLRGL